MLFYKFHIPTNKCKKKENNSTIISNYENRQESTDRRREKSFNMSRIRRRNNK